MTAGERVSGTAAWKCSRCRAQGVLYLPMESGPSEVTAAVKTEHGRKSPSCDTSERGVLSITSDLPNCQPRKRFASGGLIKQ
jgi:hypothetical protein